MNIDTDVVEKAEQFVKDRSEIERINDGKDRLDGFLEKFNFRESPEEIDELTPEDVYNPAEGETDYFFNWIEHRLRPLGGIFVWSVSPWKNAADNLDELKKLLKIAVDDSKSIAEKVDAPWQEITYFGGDKHIAKKIISCYYPEDLVPIFKTEDIEKICGKLGISLEKEAAKRVGKDYEAMSVGEKWEYLNTLLLEAKREIEPLKDEPTALFSRFLYKTFDIKEKHPSSKVPVPSPLAPSGLLFEPENELGVVSLFAEHHNKLGFPYIVKVSRSYPDMTVLDNEGNLKSIEFEFNSSTFLEHEHNPKECDYVVCWVDDWKDSPKNIEIVSLKNQLKELEIY